MNLTTLQININQKIGRYFATHGQCNIGDESKYDLREIIEWEFKALAHRDKWEALYTGEVWDGTRAGCT